MGIMSYELHFTVWILTSWIGLISHDSIFSYFMYQAHKSQPSSPLSLSGMVSLNNNPYLYKMKYYYNSLYIYIYKLVQECIIMFEFGLFNI